MHGLISPVAGSFCRESPQEERVLTVSWATTEARLRKSADQTGTLSLLPEVAEVLSRSARVVADADAPERPGNQGQGNGERDGAKQIR
jgi:hypothetical protein